MRIALLENMPEQSPHAQGIIRGRGQSHCQSCDAFKTGAVQAQVIAAND
jgi:hypothetical protein